MLRFALSVMVRVGVLRFALSVMVRVGVKG